MPGLVPGIHVFASAMQGGVDGRVKPGHDDCYDNALRAKKLRLRRKHRSLVD
jgi:hypothetical protein